MTRRILVAVFDNRQSAEAARTALLANGVHATQMGMDSGSDGAPDAHGLTAVVARLMDGAAGEDDPRAGSYADAVDRGATLLVVNDLDDEGVARASAILLRNGATRVEPHPDGHAGSTTTHSRAANPGAQNELSAVTSVGGPQVYALPNAPTGWNRSLDTAELRVKTEDPVRPEGELTDAVGLDPEADTELLARRVRRPR